MSRADRNRRDGSNISLPRRVLDFNCYHPLARTPCSGVRHENIQRRRREETEAGGLPKAPSLPGLACQPLLLCPSCGLRHFLYLCLQPAHADGVRALSEELLRRVVLENPRVQRQPVLLAENVEDLVRPVVRLVELPRRVLLQASPPSAQRCQKCPRPLRRDP